MGKTRAQNQAVILRGGWRHRAGNTVAPMATAFAAGGPTATPIKHVIIIIGENRTFDHIFATYAQVNNNDTVLNLLSQQIINPDGTPGTKYKTAVQSSARAGLTHEFAPGRKVAYRALPPALTGGPSTPFGCQPQRSASEDFVA